MIIAVNARFFGDPTHDNGNFMAECFSRITEKYPQHQFIYINDKPFDKNTGFAKNVLTVISGTETKNPVLWQYWLNYRMPSLLKKYKADVLVNINGVCSLRTKLPQCLFVRDLTYLQYPKLIEKKDAYFFKKSTPLFLAKAKTIATTSSFFRSAIIDQYRISDNKIEVALPGIDEVFKPLSPEEKEKLKGAYADGKEYFLFTGNIDLSSNLVNLLKAFSFFKKRQKSNMMLLIAGKPGEQFITLLKTFKFRNEVVLLKTLPKEELAKITAAAYALVHPVLYDGTASSPLQAMQCEVPVITAGTGVLPELCGDAALYCNQDDFEDIAEKMMLIFKNEDKSMALVKSGKIRSQHYNWNKTADLLWDSILKAVNN